MSKMSSFGISLLLLPIFHAEFHSALRGPSELIGMNLVNFIILLYPLNHTCLLAFPGLPTTAFTISLLGIRRQPHRVSRSSFVRIKLYKFLSVAVVTFPFASLVVGSHVLHQQMVFVLFLLEQCLLHPLLGHLLEPLVQLMFRSDKFGKHFAPQHENLGELDRDYVDQALQ